MDNIWFEGKKSVPLRWLSLIYMYKYPLSRCLVRSKRLSS
jgi:hypothetical protein